jgi:hypothetical protein
MAIKIKLLDSFPNEGKILETVQTNDLPDHVAYYKVIVAMRDQAQRHLTQPTFKRDMTLFGGYWRDRSGNCVVAE